MCECKNFGYLIGALYVYKGLLVVFGLFLAYESRNVKYKYINDSRFVSIAMYIVVIVVGIGAPLSLVLSVHFFIDPAYALAVFMVILATMSCLLILFIPKVREGEGGSELVYMRVLERRGMGGENSWWIVQTCTHLYVYIHVHTCNVHSEWSAAVTVTITHMIVYMATVHLHGQGSGHDGE